MIKTCRFWAETWAISTLERILNIKLVIFSSEMYNEGDIDNVLQCGQLNDDKLEKAGIFNPTHYILGEYTGLHYKLITKDGKGAFTFKKLSDGIVDLIVAKCLEKLAGAYHWTSRCLIEKNICSHLKYPNLRRRSTRPRILRHIP